MSHDARLAETAALVGDPTRAAMLHALMDGRALTASELARVAGVTPQTASEHLARMSAAALIDVEKQGRHRYHRLASADVARMLESIMQVAFAKGTTLVTGPRDAALRAGRTCYDHLAGRLGIALADALLAARHVEFTADSGIVTASGMALLARLGVDLAKAPPGRGSRGGLLCRPCLDWSERRPHIAGTLGAVLCSLALQRTWIRRQPGSRAVSLTPTGRQAFADWFDVKPMN